MKQIRDAIVQLPNGGKLGREDSSDPDCRTTTLVSLQSSIQKGMDFPEFRIKAPLLKKDKADTWFMAEEAGMQFFIKYLTHTCYNGDHTTLHYYGYGCGNCPSCKTRQQGYEKWLERYHIQSYDALMQVKERYNGSTLDNPSGNESSPWWLNVDPIPSDLLKGINSATEMPIDPKESMTLG